MTTSAPLRIVVLADDQINLLDLSGPSQAFATMNALSHNGEKHYETVLVSVNGGLVKTGCGLEVMTSPMPVLDGLPIDTLIVPGGCEGTGFQGRPQLVALIAKVAPLARRVCSLSTGVFLVAAAGQLNERTTATHWKWARTLKKHHPQTHIDADRIFFQDGMMWTSAGLASALDVALALIEQDHGHAMALKVARHLVMFIKRAGSQPQCSVSLAVQSGEDGSFADLHAWIANNLLEDLSVARLAEQVCMAPRTFARHYVQRLGKTPAKTVEAMRLEAACGALASSCNSLKTIAAKVGLINEQSMHRAFKRAFGMSPSQYRTRFSKGEGRANTVQMRPNAAPFGTVAIDRDRDPRFLTPRTAGSAPPSSHRLRDSTA
jgi:transcriptional regulator GlxA family with amidase domain